MLHKSFSFQKYLNLTKVYISGLTIITSIIRWSVFSHARSIDGSNKEYYLKHELLTSNTILTRPLNNPYDKR